MKTCIEPNCDYPQFGGGRCKYHQFRRHMAGGDLHVKKKTPKKRTPIAKESPKRKKEHPQYTQLTNEIWNELVAQKKNICLFCNHPMKFKEGFHHVKGRIEDNYLNREFMFPAHNLCHVENYHLARIEQLLAQGWYQGFLERLKAIDEESWSKELKKQDKSHKLNPRLFEESEDLFAE